MSAEIDILDTFHDPQKLIRLSAWSIYLSWIILILVVILTLFRLISEAPYYFEQSLAPWDAVSMIVSPFYTLAIGCFYFVVLQAVSEGINIWMDIHENTQIAHSQDASDLL